MKALSPDAYDGWMNYDNMATHSCSSCRYGCYSPETGERSEDVKACHYIICLVTILALLDSPSTAWMLSLHRCWLTYMRRLLGADIDLSSLLLGQSNGLLKERFLSIALTRIWNIHREQRTVIRADHVHNDPSMMSWGSKATVDTFGCSIVWDGIFRPQTAPCKQ